MKRQSDFTRASIRSRSKTVYEKILAQVALFYDMPVERIKSRDRTEPLSFVRQVAMVMCYETGASAKHVGRFFHRDHGTVLHAEKSVNDRVSCYPEVRADLEELRAQLKPANITPIQQAA